MSTMNDCAICGRSFHHHDGPRDVCHVCIPYQREEPFRAAVVDPPWNERGGGKIKRGADRHYPLLKKPTDIVAAIEGSGVRNPADDAYLYQWVTNNHLPDGLEVMALLGFDYKTTICWGKVRNGSVQRGIGQYFRGSHELCLFGVRGRGFAIRSKRRDLPSLILAPRGKHSAKPVELHDLVEARGPGPYVELFARTERPGWTCWGNEIADP